MPFGRILLIATMVFKVRIGHDMDTVIRGDYRQYSQSHSTKRLIFRLPGRKVIFHVKSMDEVGNPILYYRVSKMSSRVVV